MRLLKCIIISFIAIYLQVLFLSKINILGARLYLPLALVIYFATKLTYSKCLTMTFLISLLWDILYPQLLGLNIIINVLICHLVFIYHSSINKDKIISVFFSVLLINILYFVGYWLYYTIAFLNHHILIISSLVSIILNTTLHVIILCLLVLSERLRVSFRESEI
ncbi:MAG: hypothetical protein PHF36_07135 [Candidatus Cloacimonetes bacterium]|nr:hypothetical protein [Candidatus Cloacimonadota bacterium]